MKIRVEKADIKDAQVIALLGRITFEQTFGHLFKIRQDLLDYLNETFSVDKIKKGLTKKENRFWIAYADELPVGYAKLKLTAPSEFLDAKAICQLQKIYVLKNYLNLGIGNELQKELLNAASQAGNTEIWLSVLNKNERAIHFYLKNNFRQVGEHDFTIGTQEFHFLVLARGLN